MAFHQCGLECVPCAAGIFLKSGESPSEGANDCIAGEGTSLGLHVCTPDPRTRAPVTLLPGRYRLEDIRPDHSDQAKRNNQLKASGQPCPLLDSSQPTPTDAVLF